MMVCVPCNIAVQFQTTVPVPRRHEVLATFWLKARSGSDHLALYHVRVPEGEEEGYAWNLARAPGVLWAGRETDGGLAPYPFINKEVV